MYAVFQNVYKEPLGEGLNHAILMETVPSTRKERVMARWKQDDTQDTVKDMVFDYVSTRVDFGGPQLVDCSNFNDCDDISRRTILDGTELGQQRRGQGEEQRQGIPRTMSQLRTIWTVSSRVPRQGGVLDV